MLRMLCGSEDAAGTDHSGQVPPELRPFLRQCLADDPGSRFVSASAAIRELQEIRVCPLRNITLDIEGTLIDNYSGRNPRPGLKVFLEFCLKHFDRIFVYTMLEDSEAAEVFEYLESRGELPDGFRGRYEFVSWNKQTEGHFKDLRRCRVPLEQNAIVDDNPEVIPEDQQHRWIRITGYHEVRKYDRGLVLAADTIMREFGIFDS